jgi:hypothetical protein
MMSEAASPEPMREPGPPRRRGPPAWGIVLFLALLGGLVLVNQCATTGGRPVAWTDDGLDAARRQAQEQKRKVFLYLYEPGDRTHERNERSVFTQYWARKPLEHVVCCRVAVKPGDLLPLRYRYNNTPLFLLLDAKGNPLSRTEGAVDELQFFTYIGGLAQRP